MTRGALNRALLARQLLLARRCLPVARAVEQVAGLQAQWEPSPPLGLRTRIGDFSERSFCSLVRATLMRGTIHLVTRRDYRLLYPALRPALERYPTRPAAPSPPTWTSSSPAPSRLPASRGRAPS